MKMMKKMKARKGMPPKMMGSSKSSPSKGDRSTPGAAAAKRMTVRDLVSQKKGADGTAIKNERKLTRKARMKRLEGVKF